MTVGDLLDLTFQLFKANLGQVLPVLLVIVVPWEVLRAIAAPASSSLASSLSQFGVGGGGANGAGASAGPGALALVATIGLLLCQPVATGAVTRAVVARYRHDEVPGARGLLRGGRRWVPMVLLASVLGHLPIAVGFFVFFVPAVVFSVLWSVTAPVAAAEGLGPWRALGRSWHLVSGRFWQVLGNLLLGGTVILVAVYLLAAAPLAALDGLTSGRLAVDLGAVVSTFTAVFQLGLLGTFVALVYLNLRVRLEGLDLDALSAPATAAA